MPIAPQTNIRLVTCPLTADDENQLTFANVQAQNSYFEGLNGINLEGTTYQRKDSAIRYAGNVDDLRKYNYVIYQNAGFTNKKFYAFIREMRYVNENTTDIIIETDVYQTWMFNFVFMPSFVEREHVNDDAVGKHTYPEGLEYGDYVVSNSGQILPYGEGNIFFVMQVSDLPDNHGIANIDIPAKTYNSMPSGCYYLAFPYGMGLSMEAWINAYDKDNKQDAILAIFPLHDTLVGGVQGNGIPIPPQPVNNNISENTYIIPSSAPPVNMYEAEISAGLTYRNYVPKNNKLYCFPYCYFNVNTLTGTDISFNYEDFDGNPHFQLDGVVTAGGEYKFYPTNYKNVEDLPISKSGYGFGVNLSPLPQASWNTDTYQNWLALNSNMIDIQTASSVGQAAVSSVGNLFSLNLAGVASNAISAATAIATAVEQKRVASLAPDQARGDTATKSLTFSERKCFGQYYQMCIKPEYAKIIDDYFSMYGYRVNELKVPNINGRQNWNYVKTIGANVEGAVPQDDILKMKEILNRGCTFWHNPANFLNYNANNEIVV